MDFLILIGAICFCGFMFICIENMKIFKIPRKRGLIGILLMFALNYVLPLPEFHPIADSLIQTAINAVILVFIYMSFVKPFFIVIYMTSLWFGLTSASSLIFNMISFTEPSLVLLNREIQIQYILNLMLIVGLLTLHYILQIFIKKRIDMSIFSNRIMHIMLVCSGIVLSVIYISYVLPYTYITVGQWEIHFEDIANILFFMSSIIMFAVILWYTSRETAIKTEKLLIEASNKYIQDLEESYKMLRTIKHDYVNILSSFKLYIDNEDMSGLAKYYYDELSEMNKDLLNQDRLIGDLQNVQLKEIKSVMIYKGSVAARQNVDVNIEVRETIENIGVSTAIVCQIIGILLDNAIESAAESEERKIKIAIIKNPNSKAFIIKNAWVNQDIPITKLFELGFSTKGENRGTGLHTVRNYTDKLKGLHLETEITDEYFSQILTVKDA